VLWRHLPDLLAVANALLMSPVGLMRVPKNSNPMLYTVCPTLLLVFLAVVLLQKGADRMHFSRYFLESAPLNFLGYISYPLCKQSLASSSNTSSRSRSSVH
jgi:peptidoglycan/LPS O-acetylase OafA/YrhL